MKKVPSILIQNHKHSQIHLFKTQNKRALKENNYVNKWT